MYYFCGMLRVLLFALLLYLLYRFVFNFLIPVLRTTRRVRRQMQEMQQQMHGYQQQQAYSKGPDVAQKPAGRSGDYIDFEEVK